MHLRQPFVIPASRPLRVFVHARVSTDEQRQTNLDDQIAVCRQFLDQNLPKGWSRNQRSCRPDRLCRPIWRNSLERLSLIRVSKDRIAKVRNVLLPVIDIHSL